MVLSFLCSSGWSVWHIFDWGDVNGNHWIGILGRLFKRSWFSCSTPCLPLCPASSACLEDTHGGRYSVWKHEVEHQALRTMADWKAGERQYCGAPYQPRTTPFWISFTGENMPMVGLETGGSRGHAVAKQLNLVPHWSQCCNSWFLL